MYIANRLGKQNGNSRLTIPAQKSDSILLLALTGFSSGILTSVLPSLLNFAGRASSFLGETAFGAALAWYYWRFRGVRDGWRLFNFAFVSFVAYQAAAVVSTFIPGPLDILRLSSPDSGQISSERFFWGGCVGATFLFAAGVIFLSSRSRSKHPALIGLGLSIAGGVLAVVGWALGSSLGMVLWRAFGAVHLGPRFFGDSSGSVDANFYSLHVVWQAGMAVLLALALPTEPVQANQAA